MIAYRITAENAVGGISDVIVQRKTDAKKGWTFCSFFSTVGSSISAVVLFALSLSTLSPPSRDEAFLAIGLMCPER